MAVLKSLNDGDPLQKYQFLEVARLPSGVSEKDLWRIEAGIQMAKEEKLEYGPINERLKFREGIDAGFGPTEISRVLMGRYDEEQINNRLEES